MAIGERFSEIRKHLNMAQNEFAVFIGVQKSVVSEIEKNKREISKNVLMGVSSKCGVSIDWLLTGKGEPFLQEPTGSQGTLPANSGSVKIPLLRQTVSCGPGQNWEESDAIESYIEPLGFFPALTRAKVYAFRVSGVSMTGVGIMDGDIVLFDANPEQNLRDDIYVFAWGGEVYCKLLRFDKLKKEIYIYSVMNRDLTEAELLKVIKQDDPATVSAFRVFGRVLAWMHENRLMYRK